MTPKGENWKGNFDLAVLIFGAGLGLEREREKECEGTRGSLRGNQGGSWAVEHHLWEMRTGFKRLDGGCRKMGAWERLIEWVRAHGIWRGT